MANTEKEAIYDDQIAHLMGQIIAVCNRHQIPLVADFDLGLDENEGNHLHCTTVIQLEHEGPDGRLKRMSEIAYPPESNGVTMVTVRDGEGKVTSMTAIL